MKRIIFILSIVLLVVFNSCEKSTNELEVEEVKPILLRSSINSMTKVANNSFEVSDELGVSIIKNSGTTYTSNNKFIFDGNYLKSSKGLSWYDGTTTCNIYACYPYDEEFSNSNYNYDAAIDQSEYEDFANSIFLSGVATNVAPNTSFVNIPFKYLCTQFQVVVRNSSSEVIKSVKFLNLEYHQSFSVTFNTVSGDGVKPADIIPYHQENDGNDIYMAYVPSMQSAVFQVEIQTSSCNHLYKTQSSFSFESGVIYVVSIDLTDQEDATEVKVYPSISDWEIKTLPIYEGEDEEQEEDDDSDSFTSYTEMYNAASGYTYTSSTPMGSHYVGAHVTTSSDKTWLLNPDNEPSTLDSAPSYTWKEYDVTLYPFGTPMPADVNQHGIGDCSACAVFAEMAYVAPDFIKSIITDNGDKTYTVKMFDPQGEPVDVCISSKFLGSSSIGAVSGKNNVACWSTILEKAMMKWEAIYQVNKDVYGIGSEHVAPLFTGEGTSFAFYPGNISTQKLKSAVELSFSNKCLIIGGFTQSGALVGSSQTVSGHAYSFHKDAGTYSMFAMRNPWGYSPGDEGYTDGLLYVKSNTTIPSLIDIRVICAGSLSDYYISDLQPYSPPTFSGAESFQRFLQLERETLLLK